MSTSKHLANGQLMELLRSSPLVVVSPHLDDGIVSAFGLLTVATSALLVTVFTGAPDDGAASEWDRLLGFTSADEAMQARRDEDLAAATVAGGISVAHLGMSEHLYREGGDDDVRHTLTAELERILDETGPDPVMAVPAGLGVEPSRWRRLRRKLTDRFPVRGLRLRQGGGPHPDHRLVRDVALPIGLRRCREVLVYEDLPYANAGGHADLRAVVARHGLTMTRHELPIDIAAKERAVACYTSQYATLLPAWTQRFTDAFEPCERVWSLSVRAPSG